MLCHCVTGLHLVLELDYPFLHISALEDVYINLALYKCFLLAYEPQRVVEGQEHFAQHF